MDGIYVRPQAIDDGFYLRVRQMRPVERAASPIIDHSIELTEAAIATRGWYRGETLVVPMEYLSLLLDPDACMLSAHDFVQRVDAKASSLLESYRGISRAFEQREHEIKFGASGSSAAEETLALAKDTNARVRRMDARDARRGERERARELQEACYRYWEIGSAKEAVRNSCNGRPRHGDVFSYFRRELAEIGVETGEEFSRLLVRRQKRLSQSAAR